ncbi:MAG: sulfite exporter TauE/SafE family protein [Chloroflexota bacterium]|nr:sulfite exporter TauE/SafE family protein [Chloroflexota bacterium]
MNKFLLLAIFGLAAQLVDGSLGMAYGLTSSTLLLAAGIAPAVASASVHLAEVGTTLVSGAAHWKMGNTDWRAVGWLALPGGFGAFFGAVFLSNLSAEAVSPFIALFLVLLGAYVLVRFAFLGGRITFRAGSVSRGLLAPLGLVAGFLDAVGGGGWGPISTPTMMASGKMEPRKVIGTVDTSEFLVALCASIGFLVALDGSVIALPVVGAILLGGVIAAPIAAWLVRLLHPRILGAAVGGMIVFTNGRTLMREAGVAPDARPLIYVAIATLWIVALVVAVRATRAGRPAAVSHGHGPVPLAQGAGD